ncbi:MAG: hypothetical protein Q7J72_00690 [Candidatus Omnitrophota bacterium]|nr:hypothetical protein [Candidatus Omnitrophota bacterium]
MITVTARYRDFIRVIFWVGHLLPKVYHRIYPFQGPNRVFEKALSWGGVVVGKLKKRGKKEKK